MGLIDAAFPFIQKFSVSVQVRPRLGRKFFDGPGQLANRFLSDQGVALRLRQAMVGYV